MVIMMIGVCVAVAVHLELVDDDVVVDEVVLVLWGDD